jgi:hypothetical protein
MTQFSRRDVLRLTGAAASIAAFGKQWRSSRVIDIRLPFCSSVDGLRNSNRAQVGLRPTSDA